MKIGDEVLFAGERCEVKGVDGHWLWLRRPNGVWLTRNQSDVTPMPTPGSVWHRTGDMSVKVLDVYDSWIVFRAYPVDQSDLYSAALTPERFMALYERR